MQTETRHGLTSEQAARLLLQHGPNALPEAPRPSVIARLLRELREPMAVLLMGAAALSGILLGETIDAIAIATIIVLNAVIALVQEGRAERAMEALRALEAPSATVVRDGGRMVVAATDLVPGDLVVAQAGDQVPADIELTEAMSLQVDEAILTGESLPVSKRAGGTTDRSTPAGDRDGLLHSGTLLTRGTGLGTVIATGAQTELGGLAQRLHDARQDPTPLQRQLTGLTRRLGIAAIVIAAGTFALTILLSRNGLGVEEAFLSAVALAVAAVPEGLPAVTTVALALGVGRMAQRGAIVRRLPAVETLGATDVLVIDKTGTVTENRMSMAGVVAVDGTTHTPEAVPDHLRRAIEPILVLCNDATSQPPTGDPTERALLDLTAPSDVAALRDRAPRLGVVPFDSDRRMMSSLHRLDGAPTLLVKGAPEAVLPRCVDRIGPDGMSSVPLTESARAALLAVAEEGAGQGQRLLALASRPLPTTVHDPTAVDAGDQLLAAEDGLTLRAMVALRDPPRASARGSVQAVRDAGIRLLMATGDHPATARAIAQEVGLGSTTPLTGAEIRAHGLPEDPLEVPIYARVEPGHKLELVSALQQAGHTVAMTGDGVNDAPALREADIGVALGGTGSDVAREAADLVITDDDLATIVEAVREGRGIYDNLRKVIDYLVTSNLAEVMVVVGTLVALPSFGIPLFPLQLLWINLLTDGLPALALGVDPVDGDVLRRQPRSASSRLLDLAHVRRLAANAAVLAAGAFAALFAMTGWADASTTEARTVLFSTLVLAQVLFAFVISHSRAGTGRARNRWLVRSALLSLVLHALILVVPGAQTIFDTTTPSSEGWVTILLAGGLPPLLLLLLRRRQRSELG